VAFAGERRFRCGGCRHEWTEPFGTGRPSGCPSCGGADFRRIDPGPRGQRPGPRRASRKRSAVITGALRRSADRRRSSTRRRLPRR
jgi:hypothetical protein